MRKPEQGPAGAPSASAPSAGASLTPHGRPAARRYLGATNSGSDLCQNGAVSISFTNFSWPVGVKRDRGLNITFVSDVILPPGGVVLGANPGAAGASTSVAISFKDDTNHFRLDVSSLGLQGSTNCPSDPALASWPPPPPPAPRPCSAGPDPRRGCPALEWYWRNQTAASHVETSSIRTASIDGAPAPAGGAAGRHLLQVGGTTQTSNGGTGPRAPPPRPSGPIATTLNSVSPDVPVGSLPLTRGEQWILTANVRVAGNVRRPVPVAAPGEPAPKTTEKMLAAFDAKGVSVSITLKYTRRGLSGHTYLVRPSACTNPPFTVLLVAAAGAGRAPDRAPACRRPRLGGALLSRMAPAFLGRVVAGAESCGAASVLVRTPAERSADAGLRARCRRCWPWARWSPARPAGRRCALCSCSRTWTT